MAQHLSGPASLSGQVALITGGSGGMGRAIAHAFKNAGAVVLRIADDLDSFARRISGSPMLSTDLPRQTRPRTKKNGT